jgi:hypothetical protein
LFKEFRRWGKHLPRDSFKLVVVDARVPGTLRGITPHIIDLQPFFMFILTHEVPKNDSWAKLGPPVIISMKE